MTKSILETIEHVFTTRGASQYGGEAVTQLQHALQAAEMAEEHNGAASAIAAALLHDVGHLLHDLPEDVADDGVDDVHERIGYHWLRDTFIPAVSEPVRLHVDAKRYLCAIDVNYERELSPASRQSLQLQGGRFNADEVKKFEEHPFFRESIELRRWDDLAKIPDRRTPPLSHFLEYLPEVLLVRTNREARA